MRRIFGKLDGRTVSLVVNNEFYEIEAIRAACYKFTGNCTTFIRPIGDCEVEVLIESAAGTDLDMEVVAKEFCNEILDQQVRLDLEKRYGRVKEIIVRQAFSPVTDLNLELSENE